jgi:hypothetical protein
MLAAMYANAHRKKGARPFKPADFFQSLFEPEEEKRDALATKISAAFQRLQRSPPKGRDRPR